MSKSPLHTAYNTLLQRGRLMTNPGQAALIDRLALLQQTLVQEEGPQTGLYIYGDVGTGKSRIADLFGTTLPREVSKRRIHFHEFILEVHGRMHRARSLSSYSGDPLVRIGREVREESRVLCFDEFQVSDIADALILKRLFGVIWESGGVMVSTSNRHPTRLYERGLNRPLFVPFIEELMRRCEVWKMEGDQDYRMSVTEKEEEREVVFFDERGLFEESLERVTGGERLEPVTIDVLMNRKLHVTGYRLSGNGKMVVKCSFRDLCERNLGSADYYALCKTASAIYLDGLRQFREDEHDFVRRFITLVDLAYESKTRVVCLSSVPLFQVFEKMLPNDQTQSEDIQLQLEALSVRKEGGSSSSMMSTFIGEMEWSATGLQKASLASGGAGETDVKFAIGRAVSRLFEMGSRGYGVHD